MERALIKANTHRWTTLEISIFNITFKKLFSLFKCMLQNSQVSTIKSQALGSYVASFCHTWIYKYEGRGGAILQEINQKIALSPSVLKFTCTGWNVGHIVLQTDIANTTSK